MQRWGMLFIERTFRTLEMIGLLALTKKLLSVAYPWGTWLFVGVFSWAASYYFISAFLEPAFNQFKNENNSYTSRQRLTGPPMLVIWASLLMILVVHPTVTAIAELPFLDEDRQ